MILTLNEFKEEYKELSEFAQYPLEFFEQEYRDYCLRRIKIYCDFFQSGLYKDADEEELYKWAICLEKVFNITSDRIGHSNNT